MNNFDYLKENAELFLDQNIGLCVCDKLRERGFKKVKNVFSIGYKGANDGKILKVLQQNKWILISHDRKFVKMANKYGVLAFRIIRVNESNNAPYSPTGLVNQIMDALFINYKLIKEKNGEKDGSN